MTENRNEWIARRAAAGAVTTTPGDTTMVLRYADAEHEYRSVLAATALVDRGGRAMIRVAGKDRAAWLHNLVTHNVRTLGAGEGNYAFALNVKGRILFDLHVLVRQDAILLDVDRRWTASALRHLDKYIIMEDVHLADQTADLARIALAGPRAAEVLAALGLPQASNMAMLQSTALRIGESEVLVFRTDFCGVRCFELAMPAQAWSAVTAAAESAAAAAVGEVVWAGEQALDILRIESGIPCPFSEISEEYVPAETGQLDRAVSFNKGCYLGQEIVERMRARHVVARRLVGLMAEAEPPAPGDKLQDAGGQAAGDVTSACHSPRLNQAIALAYVRSACARPGTELIFAREGRQQGARVAALPFAPPG